MTAPEQRRRIALTIAGLIILALNAGVTVYNSIMIREIAKMVAKILRG